jgi:hypothetical protein
VRGTRRLPDTDRSPGGQAGKRSPWSSVGRTVCGADRRKRGGVPSRLQNVSTTRVDCGGQPRTREDEGDDSKCLICEPLDQKSRAINQLANPLKKGSNPAPANPSLSLSLSSCGAYGHAPKAKLDLNLPSIYQAPLRPSMPVRFQAEPCFRVSAAAALGPSRPTSSPSERTIHAVACRHQMRGVNYFCRSCCLISECYQLRRCNREHR